MRIGTISLNINAPDFNYGAMLHSWAFQQYLLKLPNVESAEIIDYTMPLLEKQNLRHPIISNIRHLHLKTAFKNLLSIYNYNVRWKKFQNFIKNNMIVSKDRYVQKSLNETVLPYDTVVCESDVIWSPGFFGGHFDKSFFLALDSMKGMKRIAYAPSMANGDLTDEQKNELRLLLNNVEYISTRESYAVEILKQFTNKSVTHVIDPVLLLEPSDYNGIIEKRLINDNYILLYLPVDDNCKLREYAKMYAYENGYKVVEISTKLKKSKDIDVLTYVSAGVEEFLSLIKYSDCVFTNSFHAICFSILFNRQFYAFSRRFAGKVSDICETFNLKRYYFPDDKFEEQPLIDYDTINLTLNNLRQKSTTWLKNALFN